MNGPHQIHKLWDDGERVFSLERWPDVNSGQSIVAARLVSENLLPEGVGRLNHEFNLRSQLDSNWALRPLELKRQNGHTALLLEDHGGEPLSRLLTAPLEIAQFLDLAIGIASALSKAHRSGLVHKDLKPTHILVNCPDGKTRLTGFGLASRLPRERQPPKPPETIVGTLAYMAPEQTGRMNRSIDSRTDLYSLGVTLYQMLTGSLPFTASDPVEWVYCHIARLPSPPAERIKTTPPIISNIIMKLLAKAAEERYQSAAAVELDLRRCLTDWQCQGHINDFTLDELGLKGTLQIPEKLYGREREVQTLISAFRRIVKGSKPELVLISGYAGIGKSAVVNELQRELVSSRGLFASGKFDQYKRDMPYATLIQAFQELVRTLLGKPDAQLEAWRVMLRDALAPNARLITDLIPELKLIIGEPASIPALDARQSQRRFFLVFRNFINVFARAEHPLALFLDDLQWLDAATLELLEYLLTSGDLGHLMLVGAYRSNEIDVLHTLTTKLEEIRGEGGRITEISLVPLARGHIQRLIIESLRGAPARVESLAQLVLDKTSGNPFFVIQFLQTLVEEELLSFDHEGGEWVWDPNRIHVMGYTDNVVDLMVAKVVRLPRQTQRALQQLACLGNVVKDSTLSIVLGMSQAQQDAILSDSLRHHLIERVDGAYAFVHDRVREAVYSLIPINSRAKMHLHIGRLLVATTGSVESDGAIFEIVGHLNRGAALIVDPGERERLAQLNLVAGQRAKLAAAYVSALAYFTIGAELLTDDAWDACHELMFTLALHRAQCEFFTGQPLTADKGLDALALRATSVGERASVACLHMEVCLVLNRNYMAIDICLAFLRQVGIEWTSDPSDEQVQAEYDRIWLLMGDRRIEDLVDLPPMSDPVALATSQALTSLFSPAFHSNHNLGCLAICKSIAISLESGHCDASSVAYTYFPRFAGRRFDNFQAGFDFGRLGCQIVDKEVVEHYRPRTYLSYSVFVSRWSQPVRNCRDQLLNAINTTTRVGDVPFSAFGCNNLISNMLFTGEPLSEVSVEAERCLGYARTTGFSMVINFIETQAALISTLSGATATFGSLDHDQFSEAFIEERSGPPSILFECWYWIRKLQARYIAGDYAAALEAGGRARSLLWASYAFIEEAEFCFYDAMVRAALATTASPVERLQHLEIILEHHQTLQIWSELCPDNFASQVALIRAELKRLEGQPIDASALYDSAIELAQQSVFPHIEALTNECASNFYASLGRKKIALLYLQDACTSYRRWGAIGKVLQLESANPLLSSHTSAVGPIGTIAASVEHLDLATVLKVSQAVSDEIVVEKLIDKVMRTAIEQAGAARGLLIVSDGVKHRVAAEASSDTRVVHLQYVPITPQLMPESVLYHVLRTRETVIIDGTVAGSSFVGDSYFCNQRARSVLCLPLLRHSKLAGALYLENNLTAGVFSPAQIAVLKLVASQAAVSLENARLYREVAQREAKIRRLVDANIIGILVWNTDGEILEANEAFLRMVGYTLQDVSSGELSWRKLTPPEYRELSESSMAEAVRGGKIEPFEKEYIRKDGSRLPVIVGLATYELNQKEGVAFVLDLTEQKLAEVTILESERRYRDMQSELAHANRVATMGQLVASIVHEVSQPIASTVASASAGQRWLHLQPPDYEEVAQSFSRIIKDGTRAADVLTRIRSLIRKAPTKKGPMDIKSAIREVIDLTHAQAGKSGAVIDVKFAKNLPAVIGDRVEVLQVLMNLVINALEAMAAVDLRRRQVTIRTTLTNEDTVLISVSDTGPGFSSQVPEQVFDPFYTTKSTGLGVGLSICRSIIEAHGGSLWAGVNSSGGALMQFTLMACVEAQALQ